ncbi:MCE family protein [Actinocorallia longicatena]|uniref:MCE family protein n=1 Tax=Actinocorallia longicatena TaxID=111803 RepID=A0ABP6Q3L9_9ACTN
MRRVLLVLLVLALSGCSLRTAGAPMGKVRLTATFDDVQTLVEGHGVQMADVRVGTVTKVELVGYRARVTLSISDRYRVPEGTTAEVAKTSLLGENYVKLTIPQDTDLERGPFMASGASFASTSVQPDFEQVVDKAGAVITALASHDMGGVVDAYTEAFADKGAKLNKMIKDSASLVKVFADQRAALTAAIDDFARLGRDLAKNHEVYADLPGKIQRTTSALAADRQKMVDTVRKLTRLAEVTNDTVLGANTARLDTMLRRIDPVLASLGGSRASLTRLIDQLLMFEERFPRAVYDGQILISATLRVIMPGGSGRPPAAGAVPPGLVLPLLEGN